MGFEELAAATLVVALGSVVQAISGIGAGFLIVPLLALDRRRPNTGARGAGKHVPVRGYGVSGTPAH